MTNNSTLEIKGINRGANVRIEDNNENYTVSYYKRHSDTVKTDTLLSNLEADIAAENVNPEIFTKNFELTENLAEDYVVLFDNFRGNIIPTGVIMSVAPYAIGVCLFGAVVIFLIGRRKRNLFEE